MKSYKTSTVIEGKDITKNFQVGGAPVCVLKEISLKVQRGEFVSVMGESGSGKSTLLYILGGLDSPTGGSVYIDGTDISKLDDRKMSEMRRRKIGFVFQFYNLIANLNVEENIMLPLLLDGCKMWDYRERLEEILEVVGLKDRRKHTPRELSGGQQQRVAIARSLIGRPEILFADEPTGNLDSRSSEAVIGAFLEAQKELNATTFMVTHDSFSASYCDRVIVMKDGTVYTELTSNGNHREFMEELLDVLRKMNGGE